MALTVVSVSTSCAWLDDSFHEKIIDDYEIGWNDLVRNQNISKPIEGCSGCYSTIVDGYVYAVGHNKNFIIAKQHAGGNKNVSHYYIIDIKQNKGKYREGVTGPVDKVAFDSLCNRLNILNISFDKNYAENP